MKRSLIGLPRFYFVILMSVLCSQTPIFAAKSDAKNVRTQYRHPILTVPYLDSAPKIDGKITKAEWDAALSMNALQTTQGTISTRQTTFFLGWDEENLYIAMRSPLRPGERLIQNLRQQKPETNVVFDDSYEIWIDANTRTPDGQPCLFQYIGNFADARFDVLQLPAVGNSRPEWTSDWKSASQLITNKTGQTRWEMEMTIPRKSLYLDKPFSDGMKLSSLCARNFKRTWEQNSIEGISTFNAVDAYSQLILSKNAPALHVKSVANLKNQTVDISLEGWSSNDKTISYRLVSDRGLEHTGQGVLVGGKRTTLLSLVPLKPDKKGAFRIQVRDATGKHLLLDWSASQKLGQKVKAKLDDRTDVVRLKVHYNPVADYVRVQGDLINYVNRDRFSSYQIKITNADGQTLAQKNIQIDALKYVKTLLYPKPLTPGKYGVQLTCLDAKGNVAKTIKGAFEKKNPAKEFDWWHTKRGNIDRVISPWTPVQYNSNKTVSVWGRTMKIGDAGLPAQITSVSGDLLASPMRLELTTPGKKNIQAKLQQTNIVQQADHRLVVQTQSQLGNLSIQSKITVAFDGMYRVEMDLIPQGKVKLSSLRMIVPMQPSKVDFYHSAGRGIRFGFDYGYLPTGSGRLWDSRKVSANPMTVGSFVPYMYVGGPNAGLSWYADNDQGWIPNDRVPAFELRRDQKQSVDVVFNFISSSTVLEKPRKIVFAFQATPIKPMPPKWRMDGWWCGDTFPDYQNVGSNGGHLIWTNIPFTLDIAACKKMVQARHATTNTYIFGVPLPASAVPYLEWKTISSRFAPEVQYFGEQWKTTISPGLRFENTLTDYMVDRLGDWAETCGIDGVYMDNVRPQADANLEAGFGYRLPDGRVQPTYQIFAVRRLLLRMRAAFHDANGHSKLVLHTTNNYIAPWLGAADLAYDGEHHVIYPESGKDFMDFWPLTRLRLAYASQWGIPVNFMHEYQGKWTRMQMSQAMRSYTGATMLFEALPSGNSNGLNTPAWIARDRFGITDKDVQFIPYWKSTNQGVVCKQPEVYLATWRKQGKLLILVVNFGEQIQADIQLDGVKLGLPNASSWEITDAEADLEIKGGWKSEDEKPLLIQAPGRVGVPIRRHNYRMLIVTQKTDK